MKKQLVRRKKEEEEGGEDKDILTEIILKLLLHPHLNSLIQLVQQENHCQSHHQFWVSYLF